ncbi:MAG: hypothetical protein ACOX6I_06280 [Syntrophomonadaceae bacterium]
MHRLKGLLIIMVILLALTGKVSVATAAGVVEWGDRLISSDPPGTADYIKTDRSNTLDIGCMQCRKSGHYLECTITNGYPGYQAFIDTEIINTSRAPVRINNITVTGIPDNIEVSLTDKHGNDLMNKVIDKNGSLDVRLVNTLLSDVPQAAEFRYQIEILINQEEESVSRFASAAADSGKSPTTAGPSLADRDHSLLDLVQEKMAMAILPALSNSNTNPASSSNHEERTKAATYAGTGTNANLPFYPQQPE